MFSGKTEELIRRTRRAEIAQQNVQVFKPITDDRYSISDVISHNQVAYAGIAVTDADELRRSLSPKTDVVAIDEVQFFSSDIVSLCIELANRGVRVIVAGLDLDYRSRPFEVVASLLAEAEYIEKLSAICVQCGQTASKSFRISSQAQQILVGGHQDYEARCRACYYATELAPEDV